MIPLEDAIITNIYTGNFGASNFTKQTLLDIKKQIGIDTERMCEVSTPLNDKHIMGARNQPRNFRDKLHCGS